VRKDLRSVSEYRRALPRNVHKAALKHAVKLTAGIGEKLNVYHPPFLDPALFPIAPR